MNSQLLLSSSSSCRARKDVVFLNARCIDTDVKETRIKRGQQSMTFFSSSSSSSSWSRQARIKSRLLSSSSSSCKARKDVVFLQAPCTDLDVKEEELTEEEEMLLLPERIYGKVLASSAVVDVDAGRRQSNELGYAQGEVLAQFVKENFGGLTMTTVAVVVALGLAYSYGFLNVGDASAHIAATTNRVSSDADMRALALGGGGGGPLMEEFWDNVRRYGFYFFTVVTGGLYSLTRPLLDLLKEPSTQILVLIVVVGSFYLLYLTVSTMLGLNDFTYQYAQ